MERLTTSDGRTLTYERKGSGPTLVCHPGGPGFSSLYLSDLGGLDEQLELVLLNPRGTGGSDAALDAKSYLPEHYADDLEELRTHLGLEQLWLLGHSHGGVAGIAYAARYPERVERLILANTIVRHGPEQQAAMQAAIEACVDEPWYADAHEALKTELEGSFVDDRELMELLVRMMPFYFASYGDAERAYVESLRDDTGCVEATRHWETEQWETFDLRPLLPKLTMPTLAITGEFDFITGPACLADLAEGIPGPETVVLPGVGHMIFVEAPEQFREAVLSFLGVGAPA
jgi:pimeloyl-ACP methyl ester carboxylesterase